MINKGDKNTNVMLTLNKYGKITKVEVEGKKVRPKYKPFNEPITNEKVANITNFAILSKPGNTPFAILQFTSGGVLWRW